MQTVAIQKPHPLRETMVTLAPGTAPRVRSACLATASTSDAPNSAAPLLAHSHFSFDLLKRQPPTSKLPNQGCAPGRRRSACKEATRVDMSRGKLLKAICLKPQPQAQPQRPMLSACWAFQRKNRPAVICAVICAVHAQLRPKWRRVGERGQGGVRRSMLAWRMLFSLFTPPIWPPISRPPPPASAT